MPKVLLEAEWPSLFFGHAKRGEKFVKTKINYA